MVRMRYCADGCDKGADVDAIQREAERHFRDVAFKWLSQVTEDGHRPIHRDEISRFQGERPEALHRLLNYQGIWVPKGFRAAVSVNTTFKDNRRDRAYTDHFLDDDTVAYSFADGQGSDRQNESLRQAELLNMPIIYFRGVRRPGLYDVYFPVYVKIDEPQRKAILDLSGARHPLAGADIGVVPLPVREKEYRPQVTCRRVHQRDFRADVVDAYSSRCAMCTLRYARLLDAAHIVADRQEGIAHVSNGLSLCKLHHAAYDADIIGVTPDHEVRVRGDILNASSGPMLTHGIQAYHGEQLRKLPERKVDKPNPEFLAQKFEGFLQNEKALR